MKAEDIFNAVTELRDEQILEGEQRPAVSKPKRNHRLGALAAVLALVMLAGVLLLPRFSGGRAASPSDTEQGERRTEQTRLQTEETSEQPTEETWSGSFGVSPQLSNYSLAAASYPRMAPYPTAMDRADADYDAAWKTWRGRRLLLRPSEDYVQGVDAYLREAIPVLLDGAAGENRVVSPLNIYMALAMLAETTGGQTRSELLSLLHASDIVSLRSRANALWRACYSDDGMETCLLGASLWLRDDARYQRDTVETLASEYYASVFAGTMGSEAYDEALRAWVNDQTGGLLSSQTEGLGTTPETAMELLTTVYLKAPWSIEFLESCNETAVFHGASGDSERIFMTEQETDTCWFGRDFTAAGKSLFGGGQMYFLLPREGVTPEELLKRAETVEFLSDAVGRDKTESRFVVLTLRVPKFDVSAERELKQDLNALGVESVFDAQLADFTPLILGPDGGLSLTGAKHGARLSIDEKGVTGAAVTEMGVGAAPPPEEQVELTLDRPFLFAVTNADGLPIFVGVVNNPG